MSRRQALKTMALYLLAGGFPPVAWLPLVGAGILALMWDWQAWDSGAVWQ